jgi:hypothetical protein
MERMEILHNHEEEDDVEGEQEDEHDEGFDGKQSRVLHVCCWWKGGRSACVDVFL